jgi:Mn2+/Fe2+ NRAMP family transporter
VSIDPSPVAVADAGPPLLTEEDTARLRDRSRVHQARRHRRRWQLLWLLAGPGILAMLGENDGPSMIAYAWDGAQYGLGSFVPLVPALFALAFVAQEMCMRVGAVTHRGFGALVLQRYGRVWGWFGAADLVLTNLVTLVAEFVAIRVGLAYFHLGSGVAVALGLALVAFTLSGGRYWRWERVVLGLALFNGLFLVAAILVKPHVGAVVSSFGFRPLPGGSLNTLLLLLASTVGATVTPWMIFFQQSASADKGMTARDIRHGRYDTALGAVLAAVFGIGALIAGAALLAHHGSRGSPGAAFPRPSGGWPAAAPGPSSRWVWSRPGRSPSSPSAPAPPTPPENAPGSRAASTPHRATPRSSTPRTSEPRCWPRRSSSFPGRRCCRSC